jgi:hypothetical protein
VGSTPIFVGVFDICAISVLTVSIDEKFLQSVWKKITQFVYFSKLTKELGAQVQVLIIEIFQEFFRSKNRTSANFLGEFFFLEQKLN